MLSQATSLHYVNYSKLLSFTSYKFTLFNIVCSKLPTDQSVSYYTLHGFVAFVFFVQSEAFLPVQLQK